jgi:hypothetical protein
MLFISLVATSEYPLRTGNADLSGQMCVWRKENSQQGQGQVSRVGDEAQQFPCRPKTASNHSVM